MLLSTLLFSIVRSSTTEYLDLVFRPLPFHTFLETIFDQQVQHLAREHAPKAALELRQSLFNKSKLIEVYSGAREENLAAYSFVKDDAPGYIEGEQSLGHMESLDAHYNSGHTLLIQAVGQYSSVMKRLKCNLEAALVADVGINAYWSPPAVTGFKLHHDGHDVLVIQTAGEKCWLVCEKLNHYETLVSESHHYDIDEEDIDHVSLGVSCKNISMREGEILYLPRGVLHAPHTKHCASTHSKGVKSAEDNPILSPSLHISVGIDVFGIRWVSLFENLLDQMYDQNCDSHTALCIGNVAFPMFYEKGAEWTWIDILKAYFIAIEKTNTVTGRLMREAIPLWSLSHAAMLSSPPVFGTGRFTPNKKAWSNLYNTFDQLTQNVDSLCTTVLMKELPASLEHLGLADREVDACVTRAIKYCRPLIHALLSNVSFVLGINKVLVYAFSAHTRRCGDLSQEQMNASIDPEEWLSQTTDLASTLHFLRHVARATNNDSPHATIGNCEARKRVENGAAILLDLEEERGTIAAALIGPGGTVLLDTEVALQVQQNLLNTNENSVDFDHSVNAKANNALLLSGIFASEE